MNKSETNIKDVGILAVTGISGSGKNVFTELLESLNTEYLTNNTKINIVKQCTTRDRRPNEENERLNTNSVYNFITEQEYDSLLEKNKIIAKTIVNNKRYGTYTDKIIFESGCLNVIITDKDGNDSLFSDIKLIEESLSPINIVIKTLGIKTEKINDIEEYKKHLICNNRQERIQNIEKELKVYTETNNNIGAINISSIISEIEFIGNNPKITNKNKKSLINIIKNSEEPEVRNFFQKYINYDIR
jgi:guanylate kinase